MCDAGIYIEHNIIIDLIILYTLCVFLFQLELTLIKALYSRLGRSTNLAAPSTQETFAHSSTLQNLQGKRAKPLACIALCIIHTAQSSNVLAISLCSPMKTSLSLSTTTIQHLSVSLSLGRPIYEKVK